MKKSLLTFFGLILFTSLGWGAGASGTITKTIAQIAERDGWTNEQRYKTFNLDDDGIISLTAEENLSGSQNGFYYSGTNPDWRCYQARNEGKFSVDAKLGYVITSVNMIYGYKDNTKSTLVNTDVDPEAVLNRKGEATMSIDNKQSVHFRISANAGSQARITQIAIGYKAVLVYQVTDVTIGLSNVGYIHPLLNYGNYAVEYSSSDETVATIGADGAITPLKEGPTTITAKSDVNTVTYDLHISKSVFVETFSKLATYTSVQTQQTPVGDNGWFNWVLKRFKNDSQDTIMGFQGLQLTNHSSNYIVYDASTVEGGVKHVSFYWRATASDKAVNFQVDNTTATIKKTITAAASADNLKAQLFDEDVNINANDRFRIKILETTASNIVVGPLTITPYLLFTNKTPVVNCAEQQSYDLKDILIDNTNAPVSYSVTAFTTGTAAPTISDAGVVDLTNVTQGGTVSITATWGSVTTTTTLTAQKLPTPVITFNDASVALNGSFVPSPVVKVNDVPLDNPTITYTSSNENVAKVEEGKIVLKKNGVTDITAHVDGVAETYLSADKKMTLTVTAFTPAENTFFNETFCTMKARSVWTDKDTTFAGDNGVYTWHANYYQRGGSKNNIAGEAGTRVAKSDGSYIETDGIQEGGVQYILYNWRMTGDAASNYVKIQTSVTNSASETESRLVDTTGVPASGQYFACAERFEVDENAKIRFKVTDANTSAIVGPITIVPYLLYSKRDTTIIITDYLSGTYTNNKLINNTTTGSISYSIEDAANKTDIATIDATSGAVTIAGAGTVKVIATWDGGVTTSYNLTIEKATPTIEFSGTEIDIFGTYTPAPKAKIGENVISDAVFTYASSETKVADVEGSTFTIKRTGTSTITATLVAGATYKSVSADATLTVNKPTTGAWEETYVNFEATEGYKTGASFKEDGKDGVYQWQARAYRFGSAADKVNGENGVSLNKSEDAKGKNYFAFNYLDPYKEVGGVKDVFFNWQILGNTARSESFTVSVGSSYSDNVTVATANVGEYYSYAKHVNCKTNDMFKIEVKEAADSAVFGPITIVPYLLYTTKTVNINVADYLGGDPYINTGIINNTGTEGSVSYSIVDSESKASIATIDDATSGNVTIHGAGTVVVKAAWSEGASTTYTLNIGSAEYTPSFATAEVNKGLDDVPFKNETLTAVPESGVGATKYSSDNKRVADVDENTGDVTIYGHGDAIITATIEAGSIYKQATASYTVHVANTGTASAYSETFKAYKNDGWGTSQHDVERDGDYFKWQVYNARFDKTRDMIYKGDGRAVWLNCHGTAEGFASDSCYMVSKAPIEGGIKRISFLYNKRASGTNTVVVDVTVGGIKDRQSLSMTGFRADPDGVYSHNFNIKENTTLAFSNASADASVVIGEMKITPYIFYPKKADTIQYESFKSTPYLPNFYNNTNKEGTIEYSSDAPTVAQPRNSGEYPGAIDILKASATPVTITATWTPAQGATPVTTSFTLLINDKADRKATFAKKAVKIKVGEAIDNPFDCLDLATANEKYYSSDQNVAIIENNAIKVVGIGRTIIEAKVAASTYYLKDSAQYVLEVNPAEDADHTLIESFDGVAFTTAAQQKLQGDLYADSITWDKNGVQIRRDDGDLIGGEQGTFMRQNAYLTTSDVVEGGVKYFSCHWVQFGQEQNTTLKLGLFLNDDTEPKAASGDRRVNDAVGAKLDSIFYYAATVGEKSNAKLTIKNMSDNTNPDYGRIVFDQFEIVPYIYYKTKSVEIDAAEYASAEYKYKNTDTIDNRVGDGTISYAVGGANADKIADIDENTGEVTILGEGTVTVTATWSEGATASYTLKINLEDAGLDFTEKTPVVLLGTGSYTQTASKTTTADVTYELEGEHGTATISESTGEVTFNGQTGTFTILATVPVALPYNLDSARYTLTVNSKETPSISFNNVEKDMNAVPFQNPMNESYTGLGLAHYTSADPSVATVVENTGWITIVGQGNATINVHFDEGDDWSEADASFTVSVSDPGEAKLQETFKLKQHYWGPSATSLNGDLFGWKVNTTRRDAGKTKEVLANGDSAVWFKNDGNSWMESTEKIEGGIKRVSFYYNKYDNNTVDLKFMLSVDGVKVDSACQANVAGTTRAATDFWFNHNIGVKENAKLRIAHTNVGGAAHLGYINITPYIYYKATKKATIDLKTSTTTCQLAPDVDNRDDKDASTIKYTFVENDVTCATIDESTGVVTGLNAGTVTVKAYWSTNENVYTTYTVTILPSKTTIKLMHNDGTEGYNEIENTIGQPMEAEVVIPTRTGYRFDAYYYDAEATAKTNRMTATSIAGTTAWVKANRTYNNVQYITDSRVWVYPGAECSIYANWKDERTITLDNQEATTTGTEEVVTAYCPNNNLVNLMDPIEVPTKTNHIFRGYFTEEDGAGTQLIDANGAFIANVTGYTDTEKNYRKWIKDEDITLYAKWEKGIILDEEKDNSSLIADADDQTMNVYLVRTLTPSMYNTFCLPFTISKDNLVKVIGDINSLATLVENTETEADLDASKKNLNVTIQEVNEMQAGKPYLINPVNKVENPTFEGVTIVNTTETSISGSGVTFYGIVSPYTIMATDKTTLFLVSGNKLAWNNTGKNSDLKGMRAYFDVPDMNTAGVAPRLVMRQPQTPTELVNVNANVNVNKVLINNHIYIIRNGVYYDMNGQIVK